jgi:hypothetical protein
MNGMRRSPRGVVDLNYGLKMGVWMMRICMVYFEITGEYQRIHSIVTVRPGTNIKNKDAVSGTQISTRSPLMN